MSTVAEGTVAVDGPLDLLRTCRALADGASDPTWSLAPDRVVRAWRTAAGPATVEVLRDGDRLLARAWGPGAEVALAGVPGLVGLTDDAHGFDPSPHPLVADLARRHPGRRLGATTGVWDLVVPTVLGQRVTTGEARRSWFGVVRRHGEVAPGPLGEAGEVRLGPSPAAVRALGDADWHVLGVERRRADAIRRIAAVVPAVERAASTSSGELRRVLETLPGVGPWTSTALAAAATGDPDVVQLGDLHVPHTVCCALAGEDRGSDERMLELLAPFAGHRGRVARLVTASGVHAPRRGPRYAPLPIARM